MDSKEHLTARCCLESACDLGTGAAGNMAHQKKQPKVGLALCRLRAEKGTWMTSSKRRSVIARIGGLSLRAKRDPLQYTKAAREAAYHRFEIEVDPQGELSADERSKRANAARRAYMQRLALRRAA